MLSFCCIIWIILHSKAYIWKYFLKCCYLKVEPSVWHMHIYSLLYVCKDVCARTSEHTLPMRPFVCYQSWCTTMCEWGGNGIGNDLTSCHHLIYYWDFKGVWINAWYLTENLWNPMGIKVDQENKWLFCTILNIIKKVTFLKYQFLLLLWLPVLLNLT